MADSGLIIFNAVAWGRVVLRIALLPVMIPVIDLDGHGRLDAFKPLGDFCASA